MKNKEKKSKPTATESTNIANTERYVNPFTDFGFKKLFGSDVSKDLLISFLNEILPDQKIANLTYKKTDKLGATDLDRKVIYDLYCENEKNEKFIVELQKAKQHFFKDRTLFYSTFPIQEQGEKGDWDYQLKAVYTVAILDFCFEDEHRSEVKVTVKLMETEKKTVFYEKLTFLYVQMPNFNKKEEELVSMEDKWLYLLKNLNRLDKKPIRLQEKIFEKVFKLAEVAKFSSEERNAYEDSLKYYRDLKNSLDTSFEEGERSKAIKVAQKCLLRGMSIEDAAEMTELSMAEVREIAQKLQNI
ncbi:MAG: Rpn family recombination-promoting nuclease/putative transposase [Cytophagales bacterium]|nr:MAG: Rpn family recombination-promoting nuclease/putative transposase [Cytophagales bacterium]